MRIWLDTDRLASYRLTTQDVEEALRRSNIEVPAGRVESVTREFNVTTATDLRKPEEFFKGLSMGKRALNSAIKNLTTKPTAPNGRINEETIILGAF